jgi:hypothetical protein
MRYWGIKTPDNEDSAEAYIWWIANSKNDAWDAFFRYPDRQRQMKAFRYPLADAIRAYEGIGYKCVELTVSEKTKDSPKCS